MYTSNGKHLLTSPDAFVVQCNVSGSTGRGSEGTSCKVTTSRAKGKRGYNAFGRKTWVYAGTETYQYADRPRLGDLPLSPI